MPDTTDPKITSAKTSVAPPPPPLPLTPQPTSPSPVFIIVVFLLLGVAGWLGYRYYNIQALREEEIVMAPKVPTPTPTPTPIILHAGKAEYTVSHPESTGPSITKVTFDPVDTKKGERLALSTTLVSDSDISSVTGTLATDHEVVPLVFTKISTNGTTSVWSTDLTLPDSVWYSYVLTITAESATGKTTAQVAPRS